MKIQARDTPHGLQQRCERFLRLHKEAYPLDYLKPKHHYLLHLDHLRSAHGDLYSCLVQERKHKTFKQYAGLTLNGKNFEFAVTADLLCEQVRQLQNLEFGTFLVSPQIETGPLTETLQVRQLQVANTATHRLIKSAVGDLAWVSTHPRERRLAKILLHLWCAPAVVGDSGFCSIVRFFDLHDDGTHHCDAEGVRSIIPLESIVATATYQQLQHAEHVRALRLPSAEYEFTDD